VGRHGRRAATVAALCALLLALAAPIAFAVPEVDDAGDLPLTAQEPGPAGPLTSIEGAISSSGDRDMYKVCLNGGGTFSATTVRGANFDTQLFLFDSQGLGVYANDDTGGLQSLLPADHLLTPQAAGVYYLAITPFNWDPQSDTGPIFPTGNVVGPTDSDGALPITAWSADDQLPGGGYTIVLNGTRSCVDTTPPTVDLRTPPDGAEYARGDVVLADYDCADEPYGSGLASCSGAVTDGAAIDTETLGAHELAVTAEDRRGNRTTVTHSYTVVDRDAPTIDLRAPRDGARYELGQVVPADYDCVDEPGAPPPTCVGDVPVGAPVDTATPGEHTFTVRSQDAAGNAATVIATYTVEEAFRFDFEGFFSPVANRPEVNAVRAGSIVRIRFSLDGFHGREVIAVGYPRSREYPCGSSADLDGGAATRASRRHRLHYQRRRNLYVYRWRTERDWAGDCRQFILKLSDGSYHRADFRFVAKSRHNHDHWRN
jgi:hypothetical protein